MKNFGTRGAYKSAIALLQKYNYDTSKCKLSQNYLRSEQIVATGKTNYQFGILVNENVGAASPRATENRLNLQDIFFVNSVQMLLGLASSPTATDFDLNTWNNPTIFTTALAATALNNLYNGLLTLSVNNDVITPSWDLARHKYVPQTQAGTGGGGTGFVLAQSDQKDLYLDSAVPCDPSWVLQGQKNNVLTINLPNAISTVQAGATTVIVFILRGFLAQNLTVVS